MGIIKTSSHRRRTNKKRRFSLFSFIKRHRKPLIWVIVIAVVSSLVINAPGLLETGYRFRLQYDVAKLSPLPAFTASDHLLIVAPHPDDETLACAGAILQAKAVGATVDIVWLTSGDGFEWDSFLMTKKPVVSAKDMLALGQKRMQEARQAAKVLGVSSSHLYFLGYPDGDLNHLLLDNYYSAYTASDTKQNSVPYIGTVSYKAAYTGANLERDLTSVIDAVKPTLILVPSPADRHPDHRAAADLMLRIAGGRQILSELHFYIVHGGFEWPIPKGLHPSLALAPSPRGQKLTWQILPLTAAQVQTKLQAIKQYRSQTEAMNRFLEAFVRTNEIFATQAMPS